MRIAFIDYSNYQFLRGMAQYMRAQGNDVTYIFSASFQSPNHTTTSAQSHPPQGVVPIALQEPFAKQSLLKRRRQEVEWGRRCCAWFDGNSPEVILAGNCPIDVLAVLRGWCDRHKVPFVLWVQDFYGMAIASILGRRYPVIGHLAGWWYQRIERRLIRTSDHTVLISPDHLPMARSAGQTAERISVLENWAMLSDHPECGKGTEWSRRHGLAETLNVVYAGTLGMKHNPALLLALARSLSVDRPDARVVVISEGTGAEWLRRQVAGQPCSALVLLPFQPFVELPNALGAADILTSILEPDASQFSVPSKTATYLCSGRAQVAAIPSANAAARLIVRIGAGIIADPGDAASYVAAVRGLLDDAPRRIAMGRAARAHAESAFAPDVICGTILAIAVRAFERAK